MKNMYDLSFTEIETFIKDIGEAGFSVKTNLGRALSAHITLHWDDFSSLPKSLRERLGKEYSLNSLVKIESVFSKDLQTEKVLFQLADSNFIESVLLRKDDRLTLCISSQSGCPVGCVFCATGNLGFKRNLTSGEMIEQVIFFINASKTSK